MGEKLLSKSEAKYTAEEGEGKRKDCRENKQSQEDVARHRQHDLLNISNMQKIKHLRFEPTELSMYFGMEGKDLACLSFLLPLCHSFFNPL